MKSNSSDRSLIDHISIENGRTPESVITSNRASAGEVLARSMSIEVTNQEECAIAGDLYKQAHQQWKHVDDTEKHFTKPLVKVTKDIRDGFRPIKADLDEAKKICKEKQSKF